MNAFDRRPRKPLALCPNCGMDSGERKCSVNIPERYYVRCASCGYTVGGSTSQSGATVQWNNESRERWGE